MAVLERLRNRAGILLAVIIGLALFGFILQDLFTSGGNLTRGDLEIGKIGRKSVSYQDYIRRIDDLAQIYKITGNTFLDEETQENIREQTWQRMVREEILGKEYSKLGIDVTSDELFDLVQGVDPHPMIRQIFTDPQTGIFNRSALFQFLRNLDRDINQKTYWLFLENEIAEERKFAKYNTLISKGLYVTTPLAAMELERRSRLVDFDYVVKRFTTIPDSLVVITSDDLKKYYAGNKQDFKQEATRDIEYMVFDVRPSQTDVRAVERWINDIKPEFESVDQVQQFINLNSDQPFDNRNYKNGDLPATINDFMFAAGPGDVFGPYMENETYKLARLVEVNFLPDSVKARHILIEPNRNLSYPQAIEEARSLADSLKNLITRGRDFALLAEDFSADPGSANLGGNLGWFREGMMVQEFDNACFNGKKGDLVVVETQFGVHLIEIQEQGPRIKKLKAGVLTRDLEPSSATIQSVYTEASRFALTNNNYDKFVRTAEAENLAKRVATDIRENSRNIPGFDSPRALIRRAFDTDQGKIILDDNNQAVFDMGNRFVVAYVSRATREGIAPLADVRSEVEFNVRKEKKAAMLASEFNEALSEVSDLEELAARLNLQVEEATGINFNSFSVPRAGLEPAVIATAVETNEGTLSNPVNGNNGVYVLKVKQLIPPADNNPASDKFRLMASYQSRASFEVFEALKESVGVKDLRTKYF